MEQLLLHAIGDYITQTDWMARKKTSSWFAALLHAAIYSLPFLLIGSIQAVLVIFSTHALIDRYRLARYVIFAKNWINEPSIRWVDCDKTGYSNDMPAWLSVWLMIIADNVIHLTINYLALKFL